MSMVFVVFERTEFAGTDMKNPISRGSHERIPTSGRRIRVCVWTNSKREEKCLI